jgi:hypothetical protein
MEENILKEILSTLESIKIQLEVGSISGISLRGPVADPPPGIISPRGVIADPLLPVRGPVADPAPWYLLDKAKLAKLKVHQIETAIMELERQIEFLKLERDLLKEEYKLKKR